MKQLPDLQSLDDRITRLESFFNEYRDLFCQLMHVVQKITKDLNELKKVKEDA